MISIQRKNDILTKKSCFFELENWWIGELMMYPVGKVAYSQNLATRKFPQCDHTVGKLSVDTDSLCSEV